MENLKQVRRTSIINWLKTRAGQTFTFEEFFNRFKDEYKGIHKDHTLNATLRQVRIHLSKSGIEIVRQTGRGRGHKAVFLVSSKIIDFKFGGSDAE